MNLTDKQLARYIDHTLLKPEAHRDDVICLCDEAKTYGFASVCVHPVWVPLVTQQLTRTNLTVGTVVGFPMGSNLPVVKAFEAKQMVAKGAMELDMVAAIGAIKAGEWSEVHDDIAGVVSYAAPNGIPVKVIIECCYLTDEEKRQAAITVADAGAQFVKTSTGLAGGGATLEDVRLLKKAVAGRCLVKAAGGIRNRATALAMIEAGADRIGTSAGVAIITG